MAYLGLTDAFIGLQDVATARATLERAKALEKGMSERERTWLSIRQGELQYAEDSGNPNGYTAYAGRSTTRSKRIRTIPGCGFSAGLADEGNPFIMGKPAGRMRSHFTERRWRWRPGILRLITIALTRTKTWVGRKTRFEGKRPVCANGSGDSACAPQAWGTH